MHRSPVLVLVAALAACGQKSVSSPTEAQHAAPVAPTASDRIHGTIAERIDASQYSYLRLQTGGGEIWAAVSKTDKPVGAEVTVVNAAWMENFKSKSMNRTWDHIAFGTLDDGARAAPASAMPPGHPAIGAFSQGKFAEAGTQERAAIRQHPVPAPVADVGVIQLPKAAGAAGRTVAEIWATRAALKDKKVAVRAKVVKATNGVLGKNWLHLRDGTGEGDAADLAIASDDVAAVGQTVLVTGVVHLDKDLGAGYHYDVIVEDAKIKAE